MRIERDDRGAGPAIHGLGPAGFRIDDRNYRALLLTTTDAQDWTPPSLIDLTVETLATLRNARPEFILLGTGATLARPPAALITALEANRIGVESMDSRAAARAWNVLRAEGRDIAAALYPLAYRAERPYLGTTPKPSIASE